MNLMSRSLHFMILGCFIAGCTPQEQSADNAVVGDMPVNSGFERLSGEQKFTALISGTPVGG